MENITPDLNKLTESINRFINSYSNILPPVNSVSAIRGKKENFTVNDDNVNSVHEISGYFELMLYSTRNMMGNMVVMDSAFTKTADIIIKILNSIGIGGSGGGFGGLFSGILGIIGGIAGGPVGAAIGGGVGGILGRNSQQLNSQINNSSTVNAGVFNQVIIKNPVTFTKAFDVEVRTRTLRGGIDL